MELARIPRKTIEILKNFVIDQWISFIKKQNLGTYATTDYE